MIVKRYDRSKKITFKKNDAGALIVEAFPSRTGIQTYVVDGKVVKEFRSEEEVFSQASLDSFLGTVVTINHPTEFVSPKNVKEYSVGTVLERATKDNDHTKTLLQIARVDAITAVETGELIELSVGYSADVVPESGEYNGIKYDAVQKNIRVNHIALLPAGSARAGATARLKLDAVDGVEIEDLNYDIIKTEKKPAIKKEKKFMEVVINGMKFDVDENVVAALKAERDIKQAKLDAVLEQIESTKKVDINALVKERVELIEQCKKLDKNVDTNLSNEDLLKAVVSKRVKLDSDKSVEYIRARFDALLEDISSKENEETAAKKAVSDLVNNKKEDSKVDVRSTFNFFGGE